MGIICRDPKMVDELSNINFCQKKMEKKEPNHSKILAQCYSCERKMCIKCLIKLLGKIDFCPFCRISLFKEPEYINLIQIYYDENIK